MKKISKDQNKTLLSKRDIRQISRLGLDIDAVDLQLLKYRRGVNCLKLIRPCSINDGIISLTHLQGKKLVSYYEQHSTMYTWVKFVPASGAASRMFADWFSLMKMDDLKSSAINHFFNNFRKYPFYQIIKNNREALNYVKQKNLRSLLSYLLTDQGNGLNLGWLPKALIPFHLDKDNKVRTALEEHLFEGGRFLRGADDRCCIHFTVSPEHQRTVFEKINAVKSQYANIFQTIYHISLSIQLPSTNVVAADDNNLPLRDDSGKLIFRPGGHGALLSNLQNLDADFIHIKNIDNVAPEHVLRKNIFYKKILAGMAMVLREKICANMYELKSEKINTRKLDEMMAFCSKELNIGFPENFIRYSQKEKIKLLFSAFNRPLRVCGMVKNEKEPGGGPFWVEGKDGHQTIQIVEGAQVDQMQKEQNHIWRRSKYFNPVDMICSTRNYKGDQFNLSDFVDHDAYLITEKFEKGRRVKALEVPGLWNGTMARWNTVLVRLPLIVFNPVKTIDDLLRPEHQEA